VPAVGCDRWALPAPDRTNAVLFHQPGDTLAGDADALGLPFGMDARSSVALAAVLENASDLANEVGFDAACRCPGLIAGLPVMELAARHPQNSAQ
jgi:hypothetical protein